jgi:hypothetical protein
VQAFPLSLPTRLATFATGLLLKKSLDYTFDYAVYPAALLILGYGWGSFAMVCVSALGNLLLIRAYDWSQQDFLLIESLKAIKESSDGSIWKRRVGGLLRSGDSVAFVVLSWLDDALIVTLYLRRGSFLYNGFTRRDWYIFVASTLTSNLLWTLSLIAIIEITRFILG